MSFAYDQPLHKMFTNFAFESITLQPSFTTDAITSFDITRNGDIATDCFLIFPTPPKDSTIITITIGFHTTIEEFRLDQNDIYMRLRGHPKLPPNIIPLKIFFNRYSQNFLPLINISLSSIRIRITHPTPLPPPSPPNQIQLMLTYTYLDSNPRRAMAEATIQKKIEQHNYQVHPINHEWTEFREAYNILKFSKNNKIFQTKEMIRHIMSFIKPTSPPVVKKQIKININCQGFVKELYWFAKCDNKIVKMFGQQSILIDGIIRQTGESPYFELLQPHMHYHDFVPNVSVYSFAESPTKFENIGLINTTDHKLELELEIEYSAIRDYSIIICWTSINTIEYRGWAHII